MPCTVGRAATGESSMEVPQKVKNRTAILSSYSTTSQSVEHPTLAQVTISWFVSASPASGSVLMAQSLEPASE